MKLEVAVVLQVDVVCCGFAERRDVVLDVLVRGPDVWRDEFAGHVPGAAGRFRTSHLALPTQHSFDERSATLAEKVVSSPRRHEPVVVLDEGWPAGRDSVE